MNARRIIDWAQSPGGKSVLGLAVIILFVGTVYLTSGSNEKKIPDSDSVYVDKSQEIRIQRDLVPYEPAIPKSPPNVRQTTIPEHLGQPGGPRGNPVKSGEPHGISPMQPAGIQNPIEEAIRQRARCLGPNLPTGSVVGSQTGQAKNPLPLSLYSAPFENRKTLISDRFAPYGRLLKCELVITVDSSKLDTPVVGLVIEDLWHDGELIIPAGVEVHGTAAKSSMRDRIAATGDWILSWRTLDDDNGKELAITGIALNYTKHPYEEKWDITDGSAGLKGYVIDNSDWADLVAIAAVFLAGVGEGMAEQTITTVGNTTQQSFGGNTKDAIGKGLQNAANLYAQRMLEAINRDGAFVRVPAGTLFYLYVTQTIDMNKADIGRSEGNAK
jgi:hypothetical protein